MELFKKKTCASSEVVGIGTSTLDTLVGVTAFPKGREVQEALFTASDGGGPVATALATIGKLGGNASMLDIVSDDLAGHAILQSFNEYQVNTSHLQVMPGFQSGTAHILVEKATGARAVFFKRSTVPAITSLSMLLGAIPLIQNASVLHINGRHEDILQEAITVAKSAGTVVSFDGGANRFSPFTEKLAAQADICIVAKDFALQYTGQSDLVTATQLLLRNGAFISGVTDGAHGSYIAIKGGATFHCPSFPMERIVDTTGCGDSYHGAFLYGLVHDLSPEASALLASAVGALNTQRPGGRAGLPSLETALALSKTKAVRYL